MANAFDRTQYPTTEPTSLAVGDRWMWKRADLSAEYSTSLYTLTYNLVRSDTSQGLITITATNVGTEYIVEVASATTAAYTPGLYAWAAFITRDSDSARIGLADGTVDVEPNAASSTVTDPRSYARQQVDTLRATLARLNATDLGIYSVSGRYSMRREMSAVRKELRYWETVVANEINASRIQRGMKSANSVQVRF